MTSGLGGQALALCHFCKHRGELEQAELKLEYMNRRCDSHVKEIVRLARKNEWLRKRNRELTSRLIARTDKYPVHTYVEGDLVEDGWIW